MKEAALRTKIRKALETEVGGFWQVIHQSGYQQKGLPDIIGCRPDGRFFGIEVKRPGRESTLTERQRFVLGRINGAGGHAAMITSVDDALEFVRRPKRFKNRLASAE